MKRAYAAAVMVASGLLAPAVMPAAQAQATPNDTAQDNQKNSGSTAHRVPPFDPGYWTPDRMRNAKPAPIAKAEPTKAASTVLEVPAIKSPFIRSLIAFVRARPGTKSISVPIAEYDGVDTIPTLVARIDSIVIKNPPNVLIKKLFNFSLFANLVI